MARSAGAIVNVLDRTDACDFITPAIVDRDPVVVAIGTEGSAPVLARQIKADVEAMLPAELVASRDWPTHFAQRSERYRRDCHVAIFESVFQA